MTIRNIIALLNDQDGNKDQEVQLWMKQPEDADDAEDMVLLKMGNADGSCHWAALGDKKGNIFITD